MAWFVVMGGVRRCAGRVLGPRLVMVGRAVAHPAATPEPDVRPFDCAQGRHFAASGSSAHWPLSTGPCAVRRVMVVAVQQRPVRVPIVAVVPIQVMHCEYVVGHEAESAPSN